MTLADEITNRLQTLAPITLNLMDDSALHAGHKGNGGGAHFTLKITSSHFCGKSQIMRHRLIYQTLTDLMPHKIHALSIEAIAADET
ncbi:MAG: BolA family transcriptional regulator [Methylotenera sp.]|nr:BolA family transcriptional regulator [Methylotenera sp.]